jgi:hypothetical protein
MLKKSMYLTLAGLLVSLTGCATAPSELRNSGPDHRATFVLNQGYQSAYRDILARQRACEQGSLVTAQGIVQGDLYTDTQSGTITTGLHGVWGVRTQTIIEVKAAGEGSTDVSVFAESGVKNYEPAIRQWLAGVQKC